MENKKQVIFGGCGGLYNYFLGIASVLQEKYDLSNIIFGGSQAGCFPAILLSNNINVNNFFTEIHNNFLDEVNQYKFGALGIWNHIVRDKINKILPDNTHFM